MKGAYILLIQLNRDRLIHIGKLGGIHFKKGYYAYVGSALNSLESRIQRHLRKEKNVHWHIDYLLEFGHINKVFIKEENKKEECFIAASFSNNFSSIDSFGCSDCTCHSHLFSGSKHELESMIQMVQLQQYYP